MEMRFCPIPYRQVHLDPGGGVRLCAWMDISIGNLADMDIKAIWNGEASQKLRESIRDGSFRFCRKTSCPHLENDDLEHLAPEEFERRAAIPELPKTISAAHDFTCNHSCPSCRSQVFVPDTQDKDIFEKTRDTVIMLLNQADSFFTCGNGDLFSSPRLLRLLSEVHPQNKNCSIGLETNGALFDAAHWEKIAHFGEHYLSVTVTPNSFVKSTYHYLNGGHDDYEALMKNLGFIRELREQGIVNHYEISIVVQERNFLELPDFARRCMDEFHVDRVIVKPLYKWFCMSDDDYWFKDVANPLHPYHEEWKKVMHDPILNNSRVFLWGARNEHEAARHPAYWQEEMAKCLAKFVMMKDRGAIIKQWMVRNHAERLILYGENVLTAPVVKMLKDKIPIAAVMAKYPERENILGIPVVSCAVENLEGGDAVLVLNFDKMKYIKRDFDYMGWNGNMMALNDLMEEVVV